LPGYRHRHDVAAALAIYNLPIRSIRPSPRLDLDPAVYPGHSEDSRRQRGPDHEQKMTGLTA